MVEKTIQEQIIRESPEIEAIKLGLLESAKKTADIPVNLPDYQVAGLSDLQGQLYGDTGAAGALTSTGGIGGYKDYLTTGRGTLASGLGTIGTALGETGPLTAARTAAEGTGQLFEPSDLSAYMNPYQQAVIDETMKELQRQEAIKYNQLAAGSGQAFGGSRFGVESAELGRGFQDVRSRALADLTSRNYQQALETASSAFENQQRRQQAQSELLRGIGALYGDIGRTQAAIGGQQLGAAELAQTSGLKDIATLQALGADERAIEQQQLDATRQNLYQDLYEPYQRLSWLSDIYKGAPSGQMTLGSSVAPSAPTPSAFQQVAGAGVGLLGAGAAAKQLGGLFG
jgi:hypothetical protein